MSINKKVLKRRYAKNVYKKRRQTRLPIQTSASAYLRNNNNPKSTNEDAAHSALSASAKSVKLTAKQISHFPKSEMINFLDNKTANDTSSLSKSDNISIKSTMLSSMSSDSQNDNKKDVLQKRTYNRNRKRIFKNIRKRNAIAAFKKALQKSKAMKKALIAIKSLANSKILLILAAIIMLSFVVIEPIVLFTTFFASSNGNFVQDYLIDVIAAYPADENDITRVNIHWQSLIVSLKEQHKKVPETVTEHYDKKKSQIADIMEDNNKVLSFISAYYMGKRWTFNEEVQNLVTQIFTEMYVIEYNFDSETKKQNKTVQIPENELPSPLPDNYTILSTYNGISNVNITENVTTVTLNYNITEKMSWDEILNKYLDKYQKEKYKNYYERKGGAIKAFSSPFAFDWSNTITSPFGYRTWDDGSTEFHKGLDFGVPNGTEILAVADGVVEVGTGCNHNYPKDGSCGCNGGFGNYVEIQCDNGTIILYGHMSQVAVQNGQTVKNGQVIGYSGCTGWSTGFHCHLQMVKDGEYIDPLVFIRPYTGAPKEKEE